MGSFPTTWHRSSPWQARAARPMQTLCLIIRAPILSVMDGATARATAQTITVVSVQNTMIVTTNIGRWEARVSDLHWSANSPWRSITNGKN